MGTLVSLLLTDAQSIIATVLFTHTLTGYTAIYKTHDFSSLLTTLTYTALIAPKKPPTHLHSQ